MRAVATRIRARHLTGHRVHSPATSAETISKMSGKLYFVTGNKKKQEEVSLICMFERVRLFQPGAD